MITYQLLDRQSENVLASLELDPLVADITPVLGEVPNLLPVQDFTVDVPYDPLLSMLSSLEAIAASKRVEVPASVPAPRVDRQTRMNVVGGVTEEDRRYPYTIVASETNYAGQLVESYFVDIPLVGQESAAQANPNAPVEAALMALSALQSFVTKGQDENALLKRIEA